MSPVKLGIGCGIAGFLLYVVAHASGNSGTRYINVEGTTFRIKKLEHNLFEVAVWGNGIVFDVEPGAPLATYVYGKDGPISAGGNPTLIDFIEENVALLPTNLFSEEMKQCSKPGCSLDPTVSGRITARQVVNPRAKHIKSIIPFSPAIVKQLQLAGLEFEYDPILNAVKVFK